MKSKKCLALLLSLVLLANFGAPAAFAAGAEADTFLQQLEGSYDALFSVLCAPEYDQIWLDACAEGVGAENAQAYADVLKSSCVGELYGEAAMEAYAENLENAQFNCFFLQDIAQFTVAGNQISGVDAEGNSVFSHEYRYLGDDEIAGFTNFRVYESVDADSGEFTYFTFAPDTPAETFHIEFRYGSDRVALAQLTEGPYAYWLAAGMRTPYSETEVKAAIELFCAENLGAEEEEAA